ncbi:MAG: hypothetical protein SGJ18_13660 [Pseudomonadota bacterium]|nr:hypothetical protein [Pseudomonadota bacterium]
MSILSDPKPIFFNHEVIFMAVPSLPDVSRYPCIAVQIGLQGYSDSREVSVFQINR